MPWMTPLSASISGSTTIATPVSSCSTGIVEGSAPATASCGAWTTIADAGIASLFGSACAFDFRDGGLEWDHQDDPGGATDPERPAAKRFNLDFAVQEVLRQEGRARDDVRLDYRFDCLPALLSQEPLEHAGRQLAECFIDRGENRKGPLTLELLIHPRGLKQVQEAVEPAELLRGLHDVGGLHGPSTER